MRFLRHLIWVAWALSACLLTPALARAADAPLKKVSLQLVWKHQFEFAGFYAAIEKGFYKDAGLDVELFEYDGKTDLTREVVAGRKVFGIAEADIVGRRLHGAPVVLLSNYYKRSPLVIAARPDIRVPADLKGKRLMIAPADLDGINFSVLFRQFGLKKTDMQIIPHSFKVEDFLSGKVDAMSIYLTNELFALQQSGVPYSIIDPGTYGVELYGYNLITSENYARQHRDDTRAFKQASDRGWAYALEHSDEIVDLILTKYNTQNKSRAALQFEARETARIMLPKVYPIGSIDPAKLRYVGESYVQAGEAKSLDRLAGAVFDEATPVPDLPQAPAPAAPADHADIQLTLDEIAYLKGRGELTMCVLRNWMPYMSVSSADKIEGISADLIALMQERLGTRFALHPLEKWNEQVEAIRAHKCDVLPLVINTSSRRDVLNVTTPYITHPLVIATRNDEIFIRDIRDIGSRKVGIVKGYAFIELLRQYQPNLEIVEVDDAKDGLERVRDGVLWGYIDVMPVVGYALQKHAMLDLKIAGKLEFELAGGFASRVDEPLLGSILQKAVDAISDEERQAIINKWVSVRVEQGIDYSLIGKIVAVVAVMLLIVVLRNRSLSRFNRELTQAQETSQLLSNELQSIFDNAEIGIVVTDSERRIMRMNDYCETVVLKCPPNAYIGQAIRTVYPSQEAYVAAGQKIATAGNSAVTIEQLLMRHDGSLFLSKSIGSFINSDDPQQGMIWLVNDVTEQREAEERLARALKELEVIFQNVPIGIAYTQDRRVIRANRAFAKMFGYSEAEIIGHSARTYYATDEGFLSVGRGYATLVRGETFRAEVMMRCADGSELLCALAGSKVDPDDPSRGDIWTYQDVTELRRVQSQLIQSEKMASLGQLIAGVAHEINTPIAAIKSSGANIIDALDHALDTLPKVLLTLNAADQEVFQRLISNAGKPCDVRTTREERALVRGVEQQLSNAGIPDGDAKARVLVHLNAHTTLSDYLTLLRHPECPGILDTGQSVASIVSNAGNINIAVDRVAKIIFALKSFSRQDAASAMIEVDLRDGIETVLTIYHSQIRRGTELVRHYETIPPLRCLPDELNQVWTNLIHNALQAMNHQGTLTIGIERVGGDAVVSVSDTGCGIPEKIRSRIFDAFFTTKPTGEGSGLGLDIVKKIVDKHHGRIEVASTVGKGTSFSIFLPYDQPA